VPDAPWFIALILINASDAATQDVLLLQEEDMGHTTAIHRMFAGISSVIARMRRASDFTCQDCERSYRCAVAASEGCDFRTEQVARGDWKARRRAQALIRAVPWA
jgi:hypothetical protein